ncbi:MAG: 30S ribosomal protein S17 [Candidatus Dojkabacteria bacterium]|nr:MAG: 30S ribosomal protein S17 [Candidatus Dojkabacteria bacterium]
MARSALQGEITKVSGNKTYRVTVSYKRLHPLYKKIVTYKKSHLVHSENEHEVGEKVSIVPAVKKISKMKHYVFVNDNKVKKK